MVVSLGLSFWSVTMQRVRRRDDTLSWAMEATEAAEATEVTSLDTLNIELMLLSSSATVGGRG